MRARMTRLALAVVATAVTVGAPIAAKANGSAPAGAFNCALTAGVVFKPAQLANATAGSGVFGNTVGVPSAVACTGTLTGTASISGNVVYCPPQGNETACTSGGGVVPNNAAAPVWKAINSGPIAPMTHVYATGVLTPTSGQSGLHYSDDPLGIAGPVTCGFVDEGQGTVPAAALKMSLTCKGFNEPAGNSRTYSGVSAATFAVLLSVSGNNVTTTDSNFQQMCPDPAVSHNPIDADCFRAVYLGGQIEGTYPG